MTTSKIMSIGTEPRPGQKWFSESALSQKQKVLDVESESKSRRLSLHAPPEKARHSFSESVTSQTITSRAPKLPQVIRRHDRKKNSSSGKIAVEVDQPVQTPTQCTDQQLSEKRIMQSERPSGCKVPSTNHPVRIQIAMGVHCSHTGIITRHRSFCGINGYLLPPIW